MKTTGGQVDTFEVNSLDLKDVDIPLWRKAMKSWLTED